LKRYALIFLAAIFVPSLILGWLALRTAGEQRVLIERQAADLHQAETDALAAEMRALIEEKQHAFDEIVRALISKQDAAALAGDYGNQLFSAWHEGGIPFAISPEGILVFPTPAHAVTNPAFEEFLWYNSAFLSNNTVEEVFQTQQTSSFKENSPHEKEAGRTARAATIPITTNPPSDKADTRLQKRKISTSEHCSASGHPGHSVICFLAGCTGIFKLSHGGRRRGQRCSFQIRSK